MADEKEVNIPQVDEITWEGEVYVNQTKARMITGLKHRQIYNLVQDGTLKAIMLNGNSWILKSDAEDYERTDRGKWASKP